MWVKNVGGGKLCAILSICEIGVICGLVPAFAFRADKGWSLRLRGFRQLHNRANSKREPQEPAKVQLGAQRHPHRETRAGGADMALHNGLLCGERKTGVTGSIPEFHQPEGRVNEETKMRRGSNFEPDSLSHSHEIP